MSQKKKNPVATVCSLLGTILLIVLILGCIPLTVPKAFGYNIYTVISGSMEPSQLRGKRPGLDQDVNSAESRPPLEDGFLVLSRILLSARRRTMVIFLKQPEIYLHRAPAHRADCVFLGGRESIPAS